MPSAFTWTVRVYYEDTDAGGIVFYANYLKFFERARTEWLRAAEIGQQALLAEHGAMFVVKSASLDYHAPAKLDDVLNLTLTVEKLGRASVQFVQEAWCGERLLTSARVKVGCVDAQTLRPCPVPDGAAAKMRLSL
ncbi:MAG: tol-pal system-associated acyl-CoA thioesterase [Pseudomonadota bacterium]